MAGHDKCCVKGCRSTRKNTGGKVSFHVFPAKPPARREIWVKFAGRKKSVKKSWKLCSLHFVKGKPSSKPHDVDYVPTRNPSKKAKKRTKNTDPMSGLLASIVAQVNASSSSAPIPDSQSETMDQSETLDQSDSNMDDTDQEGDHPDIVTVKQEILDSEDDSFDAEAGIENPLIPKSELSSDFQSGLDPSKERSSRRKGIPRRNPAVQSFSEESTDDSDSDPEETAKDEDPCDNVDEEKPEETLDLSQDNHDKPKKKTPIKHNLRKPRNSDPNFRVSKTNDDDLKLSFSVEKTEGQSEDDGGDGSEYSGSSSSEEEGADTQTRPVKKGGVCPICEKDFGKPCKLKHHMRVHTGINDENGVRCPICAKLFANKYNLKAHMKSTHMKHKEYMCDLCGRFFARPQVLKRHRLILHSEDSNVEAECTVCGKTLSNKHSLLFHMRRIHNVNENLTCEYCNRQFAHPSQLKTHLLVHTKEKTFQCCQCGKAFLRKEELNYHERMNHNETMKDTVSCDVCGKVFPLASRLRAHMVTHSVSSHECPYCHKLFKHKSNMKGHIRGLHEMDESYVCSYCQKRFSNSYNLKVHLRIHTGDKPYSCSVCFKGYTDPCNFWRHEQKCREESRKSLGHQPVFPQPSELNISDTHRQSERNCPEPPAGMFSYTPQGEPLPIDQPQRSAQKSDTNEREAKNYFEGRNNKDQFIPQDSTQAGSTHLGHVQHQLPSGSFPQEPPIPGKYDRASEIPNTDIAASGLDIRNMVHSKYVLEQPQSRQTSDLTIKQKYLENPPSFPHSAAYQNQRPSDSTPAMAIDPGKARMYDISESRYPNKSPMKEDSISPPQRQRAAHKHEFFDVPTDLSYSDKYIPQTSSPAVQSSAAPRAEASPEKEFVDAHANLSYLANYATLGSHPGKEGGIVRYPWLS